MADFIVTFIAAVIATVIIGLVLASIIVPTYFAAEAFGFVGAAITFVVIFAFWITIDELFL